MGADPAGGKNVGLLTATDRLGATEYQGLELTGNEERAIRDGG